MKVLALDSNSDALTRRGSEYRKEHVYPHLEELGVDITRFEATPPPLLRELVKAEATKPGLNYITGVGHGKENISYTGNSGDELYSIGRYDAEEVTGKIVHFLSCGIGSLLGTDLVEKGCVAFFGYKENFAFLDDVADTFFECDSEIDRLFADGMTAEVVFNSVIDLFTQRIRQLRNEKKPYQATWLRFNRDSLCAPSRDAKWGNPNAKLG
jgi:hypothetical protein